MKKKLLKGLLFIALGYLLLVALHFLYLELGDAGRDGAIFELTAGDNAPNQAVQMELPAYKSSSVRNYATVKFDVAQSRSQVEQKYEKIASVSATTAKYAEDEGKARAAVKVHNALIQEEAVNNYNGHNVLNLTIGVPPGEFDATVADLKLIGKLQDFQVTKTDKTNDFLELKAKRTTLEKARDSLVALKAQGGKIDELVKLEQEVLKLEDQIQGFGVQLGQFDQVNEFCTVRFTLAEVKAGVVRSPHFGYLISSLHWAADVYLMWLGVACAGLVAVLLLLIIVDKSRIFRNEP